MVNSHTPGATAVVVKICPLEAEKLSSLSEQHRKVQLADADGTAAVSQRRLRASSSTTTSPLSTPNSPVTLIPAAYHLPALLNRQRGPAVCPSSGNYAAAVAGRRYRSHARLCGTRSPPPITG